MAIDGPARQSNDSEMRALLAADGVDAKEAEEWVELHQTGRVALSDGDIANGVPIMVEAWLGPFARVRHGCGTCLITRSRAIELQAACGWAQRRDFAFKQHLTERRLWSHWRNLVARRVHGGARTRQSRAAPVRRRGSRRVIRSRAGPSGSELGDEPEPPSGRRITGDRPSARGRQP